MAQLGNISESLVGNSKFTAFLIVFFLSATFRRISTFCSAPLINLFPAKPTETPAKNSDCEEMLTSESFEELFTTLLL